jgi:hypothetical protein
MHVNITVSIVTFEPTSIQEPLGDHLEKEDLSAYKNTTHQQAPVIHHIAASPDAPSLNQ